MGAGAALGAGATTGAGDGVTVGSAEGVDAGVAEGDGTFVGIATVGAFVSASFDGGALALSRTLPARFGAGSVLSCVAP